MSRRRLLKAWAVFTWTVFATAGLATDQAEKIWTDAVSLFQAEKFSAACSQFENWEQEALRSQMTSRELHTNLALCYSKLERWDKSAFSILKAIHAEWALTRKWVWFGELVRIQEQIGIKDSPAADLGVKLKITISPRLLKLTLSLALWGIFIPLIYFLLNGRASDVGFQLTFGVSSVVALVCGSLLLQGLVTGSPAILSSEESQEVSVFSIPSASPEHELVKLPRGTLVVTLEPKDGLTHIQQPVAGWVMSNKLLRAPTAY